MPGLGEYANALAGLAGGGGGGAPGGGLGGGGAIPPLGAPPKPLSMGPGGPPPPTGIGAMPIGNAKSARDLASTSVTALRELKAQSPESADRIEGMIAEIISMAAKGGTPPAPMSPMAGGGPPPLPIPAPPPVPGMGGPPPGPPPM